MRHQYTYGTGELQYKKTEILPYSIIRTETTSPASADDDGDFTAILWGLAKWVPNDGDWHMAIFGSFRRDGRHVEYGASVIYEDGQPIHDPLSEMIDDIYYLM
ncbi:MAG: hypothetical protein KAX65_11410 [Caldilineaceae bacterium]|nr:hypothetical protein [Caldilineaceae bacterium]